MADSPDAPRFTYRAFISYSHRDQGWARWLIRKLETYRIPRDLAGTDGGRRLGTFFRDRDEAAAADDLATAIRTALETSEHLIVVASPASAKSTYVDREIRDFAALNRARATPGRILTLIADGEPNADDSSRECLPPALRGELTGPDGAPIEPLAADARPTGDGRTRALAKLVAGLIGVRYDALVRRDLQRRRHIRIGIAATACAVAVIAAGVGWKFEVDRREREQLEEARAKAESDRSTVAAVSAAERAKASLAGGDIDRAVRLARASLPGDGSLPFIPQAYATLYTAYMLGDAPINLEIVEGLMPGTFTTALSDGQYLSWSQIGLAKVWSPTRGITYATEGVSSRLPSVTSAHDAVFLAGRNSEVRYRVDSRNWDEIDIFDLDDSATELDAVQAIDADTVLACVGDRLMRLDLPPTGGGAAAMAWQTPIEGGCQYLATGTDGAIIAAGLNGSIVQIDPASHREIRRYAGASSLIIGIAVHGDRLEAREIGSALLFHLGTDEQALRFTVHGDAPLVSPDGRFAVETDDDAHTLAVHDIADGKTEKVVCNLCTLVGFDGDTVLVRENQKVVAHSLPDGKTLGVLHQFDEKIDKAVFVSEGKVLIGIRDLRPETVVRLGIKPRGIAIVGQGGSGSFLTSAAFVGDDAIALVEAAAADTAGAVFRRHTGRVVRATADGPETLWQADITGTDPGGFGTLQPLGHDLILVRKGESMMSAPFKAEILDPFARTTIFIGRLINETETIADGRLLVEEATGISLIDLTKRTVTAIADSAGRPDWAVAGDRLLMTDREGIEIRDLAVETAEKSAAKLKMNGAAETICVAGDNDTVYAITSDGKLGYIERWSLSRNQRTGLATLSPTDDEDTLDEIITLIQVGRAVRKGEIRCTADTITLDGAEKRLSWVVDTNKPTLGPAVDEADPPPEADPDALPATGEQVERSELVLFDTVAALRDRETGAWLFRTPDQESRISAAKLLVRHGWLVVGLENGSLRAWDMAAPAAPLIDIKGHESRVDEIDVNPSETEILSIDHSGRLRLWPTYTVPELIMRASEILPSR